MSLSQFINFIILILILIICVFSVHKNREPKRSYFNSTQITFKLVISSLTFLIVCVFLLKIKLLVEEIILSMDHDINLKSILHSFNFNPPSWIVIAITFFTLLVTITGTDLQIIHTFILETFFAIIFSLLLLYSVKILECKASQVQSIFNSGGLDPGTAMACSYFYGYLKIMLPSSGGTERAGILSGINQYEAKQHVTISVKKLFILIPSSSYISPDLREMSEDRMENSGKLDTIVLNRAGIINRTYHNSVYKIHSNDSYRYPNSSIFLVVEGATPLKTYLETRTKSSRYGSLYKDFNAEIIRNFYMTLKNLLDENPDCRNFCELVYYNDDKMNAADVLIDRVKFLLSKN